MSESSRCLRAARNVCRESAAPPSSAIIGFSEEKRSVRNPIKSALLRETTVIDPRGEHFLIARSTSTGEGRSARRSLCTSF